MSLGKRVLMGLMYAAAGYVIGAFGGGYLVSVLSSNQHDGSVEAAMTGAFVLGPILALVGLVVGLARTGPAQTKA
jgi:hypothetical protein